MWCPIADFWVKAAVCFDSSACLMSAAGGNILTADISKIDLSGSHLSAGSVYFTELCLLEGPVFYFLS